MTEALPGIMMKRISEEIGRRVNEQVKRYQLTLMQGEVIIFLSERDGKRATQKQLEEHLHVSHPTTVTIVKSMQAKSMVTTSVDEDDRRMKIITLNWGDENLYAELRKNAEGIENMLLDGFSEDERELFIHFLEKAYKNIKI